MPRSLLAPLLLIAAVFAPGAEGASAESFCVEKPECIGTDMATIDAALNAAEVNDETDSVFIGANGGVPYEEFITYTDATEIVHIVGDGRGQTIIEGPTSFSVAVTLLSPNSTIESLTIRAPDVSNGMALRWNATATDIQAVHSGSTATSTIGMRAEGAATLDDSIVSVLGSGMFGTLNTTNVKIKDSTLFGAGGGIAATGGGTITIERSSIVAKRSAIQSGGTDVNVYSSILRVTGDTFSGDAAISALSGSDVQVRHATMVGAGANSGIAVDATSGDSTVTVFDSIIDNFEFALRCSGTTPNTATLGVSYSDWTDPTSLTDPRCADTLGAGNLAVDPVFVAPSALIPNFRLIAPSPLIDAGAPSDPIGDDLAGATREVDGDGVAGARSDMGAYEYQRQAPIAKLSATPVATVVGGAVEFSAKGSVDPDPGDTLTYSWDFGDGATATGASAQHSYGSGGAKTVTMVATDPSGLQATATTTVQVSAAPSAPPSVEPPIISGLRAAPKRVVPGRGAPKLVPGGTKGIRFSLNVAAELTMKLARCKGKAGCAKRATVKGEPRFTAPAGRSAINFNGRFAGKTLPPGRYQVTLIAAGGSRAATVLTLLPRD